MCALIRNLTTRLFYAGDGRWTVSRARAYDFRSARVAAAFAEANRFRGVELVLTSDSSGEDLMVALEKDEREWAGNVKES